MFSMMVHGGAGEWLPGDERAAQDGVRRGCEAGFKVLVDGGSAVDAVVHATMALEDDPTFNAGTGAGFNIDGDIEMDASLSIGEQYQTGAVANVRGLQNPILLAQAVLERTDHVLLVGRGAERFAKALGFPAYNAETPRSRATYERLRAALGSATPDAMFPRMKALLREFPELSHGTVGAVAVDALGHTAAATSTGGIVLKLVGRVGDSPIPGAGNYATPLAAASATGRGEQIMRALTTYFACQRVELGDSAQAAVDRSILRMRQVAGADAGLILVTRTGDVAAAHGTPSMPHAWQTRGMSAPSVRLRAPL